MVKGKPYRLTMNLQTFAEGDSAPSEPVTSTPPAAAPPVQETPSNVHNVVTSHANRFEGFQGNNPLRPTVEAPPAATPTPPVEQALDFGGRKIVAVDPSLQALHGDWQEMNRTLTRMQEENRIATQRIQLFEQQAQVTPPVQTAPVAEPPVSTGPSEERIKELDDQYNEMLYEKGKIAADRWLYGQEDYQAIMRETQASLVDQVLTDRQQQQQANQAKFTSKAEELHGKYPDFAGIVDDMQKIVKQFPHLANVENMETVYFMAKGMRTPEPVTAQTPQPLTVDQVLSDPTLRQQLLQNPDLQKEIVGHYINNRQEIQSSLPAVGTGAGGQPPTLPPKRPENLSEASAQARSWWAKRNQNPG